MSEELSPAAAILTGVPAPDSDPDENLDESESLDQETDPLAVEDVPEAASDAEQAPTTVKELAEKLGVRPAELYNMLKIDTGDGESMTLSEMKDRAKDLKQSDKLLADSAEKQLSAENEILRRNRELQLVAQKIGRNPTEAERAEATATFNQYAKEQKAMTLDVIGDWADPAVQRVELKLIGETLTEYGFRPSEIEAILDHRQVKLLRDYTKLRQRLKDAGASEVKVNRKQKVASKRKSAPTKQSPTELFKAGKITKEQAILRALANG